MCGLVGGYRVRAAEVEALLPRILHRGPDGQGIRQHGDAVHGHVRLALLDLSEASAQPFRYEGTTLTYNGELWNHQALRDTLSAQGCTFRTSGDTEVLAALLHTRGLEGLVELDGMFAFAWSSADGGHWLVRDAFGKIPLYVAKTARGYLWGSERKAFPRGVVPIPVPPGHAFDLVRGTWRAWYRLPAPQEVSVGFIRAALRDGVRKRLAADAPVCCLISGGMDSALILALAREQTADVTAYTATFDPNSADARSARKLCAEFGVRLVEVPIPVDERALLEALRSIEIGSKAQIEIAALCIPLARRIYADGFRACLSGEAADELFGGYGNFCIKAARASDAEVVALRRQALEKMARGNFVRCNKAFMAAGVECRLPFMEQDLVERAVQLGKGASPPGKKLLKQAARGIVPDWVIRRTKETFQGGSGVSQRVAGLISNPAVFYNQELRRQFGYLPRS